MRIDSAGRGIAAALGGVGATVICTGRSSTQRAIHSDYDRNETIEETAELVTSLGGKGIPAAMDHLLANEVKTLAERLHNEFGKIDTPTHARRQEAGLVPMSNREGPALKACKTSTELRQHQIPNALCDLGFHCRP